jgi:hypothetical protein
MSGLVSQFLALAVCGSDGQAHEALVRQVS